jgi:hypothetical protein
MTANNKCCISENRSVNSKTDDDDYSRLKLPKRLPVELRTTTNNNFCSNFVKISRSFATKLIRALVQSTHLYPLLRVDLQVLKHVSIIYILQETPKPGFRCQVYWIYWLPLHFDVKPKFFFAGLTTIYTNVDGAIDMVSTPKKACRS